MKKILQLCMLFIFFSGLTLSAQVPPPPPSNAGSGGGPVGASSPLGSGTVIFMVMAAIYTTKRISKNASAEMWKE